MPKLTSILWFLIILLFIGSAWVVYEKKLESSKKEYDIISEVKNFLKKNDSSISLSTKLLQGDKPVEIKSCDDWKSVNCNKRIVFKQLNNTGKSDNTGRNFAIIFDPKSSQLDFGVSMGLKNAMYEKDADKYIKNYSSSTFAEILQSDNSKLNGKSPLAAINADYIDIIGNPQGLNVSRGVDYSGIFKYLRSSFGVSGGDFASRTATIGVGKRSDDILNYNLVGGNGRFYTDGLFKDICGDIGESACNNSTNRSMAVTTSSGYVVLLVHQSGGEVLLPIGFKPLLEGVAKENDLGSIKNGLLFDGGKSPAIFYNNDIYINNYGPIGSVFLIYEV